MNRKSHFVIEAWTEPGSHRIHVTIDEFPTQDAADTYADTAVSRRRGDGTGYRNTYAGSLYGAWTDAGGMLGVPIWLRVEATNNNQTR